MSTTAKFNASEELTKAIARGYETNIKMLADLHTELDKMLAKAHPDQRDQMLIARIERKRAMIDVVRTAITTIETKAA